jgi:two-component sensor histidine kinase
LNAVINYLEIALESILDDETKETLRKSHSASQSLVYVIDDLLNLTSAHESNFAMLEASFDIKAGIIEILDPLQAYAEQKSLSFEITAEPMDFPTFVKGDLQRFQQILSQVVSNAIRHTREGSIKVETKQVLTSGAYCVLETRVSDTGDGLSEAELDDIFQDLEQISTDDPQDNALLGQAIVPNAPEGQVGFQRNSSRARLGLGLALVARFILLRDGQLRMKSTKNEGTVVTLSLPWMVCSESRLPIQIAFVPSSQGETARRYSQERSSSASGTQSLPENLKAIKMLLDDPKLHNPNPGSSTDSNIPTTTSVLPQSAMVVAIADDNKINLQVLHKRLEMVGHKVLVSRNGQECFETFEKNSTVIDFILMDLDVSFLAISISGVYFVLMPHFRCPLSTDTVLHG